MVILGNHFLFGLNGPVPKKKTKREPILFALHLEVNLLLGGFLIFLLGSYYQLQVVRRTLFIVLTCLPALSIEASFRVVV